MRIMHKYILRRRKLHLYSSSRRRLDVRFDDVGTFDDDGGDDSVLDFFLSRFNFKRFDVPGGVGSCFEIEIQESGETFGRTIR